MTDRSPNDCALRKALRVSRNIGVAICDRIAAPVLVGIVRPLILLPPAALSGWSPEELEMVLLHELAHVRRWDRFGQSRPAACGIAPFLSSGRLDRLWLGAARAGALLPRRRRIALCKVDAAGVRPDAGRRSQKRPLRPAKQRLGRSASDRVACVALGRRTAQATHSTHTQNGGRTDARFRCRRWAARW